MNEVRDWRLEISPKSPKDAATDVRQLADNSSYTEVDDELARKNWGVESNQP
jgi:hypothetical protein